ncbi:MAG: PEGA domain-containing protein [Thermoanaerobaculales bacterium]
MIVRITVGWSDDRRVFAKEDFPLSVGGSGCDIEIPSLADDKPLAYLGHEQGDIYIQPAESGDGVDPVICNGITLVASRWLGDGDDLGLGGARISCRIDAGTLVLELLEPAPGPRAESSPAVPETRNEDSFPAADGTVTPMTFSPRWELEPRRRRRIPRPRTAVTAAGLIALALCAWFIFTARAVRIELTPEPARLAVRGALTPRIAGRYILLPGRYTVHAEKPGYLPLEASLEVNRDTPAIVRFTLEPRGAALDISSKPVDGARVMVDGTEVGTTPLEGLELSAGVHRLEIAAPLHLPFTATIRLEPGGPVQTVEAELKPNWAHVTVATNPPGATVTVDGVAVGTTPATTKVEAGQRYFELAKAGFKTQRRRVQVVAGEPLDLGTVTLDPEDGRLMVISEPAGASVTVDGIFRGRTPLEVKVTPDTPHEVRMSQAGYATSTIDASVGPLGKTNVRAVLEIMMGEVMIRSLPPGADLLVDGDPRGSTDQTLRLEARPHSIEIRMDGYAPFRTTVEPAPGLTQEIRAELLAQGPASLPRTVTSPQGVELRLVAPGRFRMGASRREPGRRANETLREVEISRPFYLAVTEVSNREFREFRENHLSGAAGANNLEIDHHPVVRVTWEDAARYCNWLSERAGLPPVYVERGGTLLARSPLPLGFRLPTEAEWAWAARHPDTRAAWKYPWGSTLPVPPGAGNFGDLSARSLLGASVPNYRDDFPATAPVGSFDANPLGIFNLGGNVSEWVHDIYSFAPPAMGTVELDPTGPETGKYHVIRGASWTDTALTELRLTYRDYGGQARQDVGFRIAKGTP